MNDSTYKITDNIQGRVVSYSIDMINCNTPDQTKDVCGSMKDWCYDNIRHGDYYITQIGNYKIDAGFSNIESAMAFKLRWL